MMDRRDRFLLAQDDFGTYRKALREMKTGRKTSHWIWFIFPQIHGMGRSAYSIHFAIESAQEAREYLSDDILGVRLREITRAVLGHRDESIQTIMGSRIDAVKFRSSMTLFDAISPGDVFGEALDAFFDGKRDRKTLEILSGTAPAGHANGRRG